MEDYGARHSTVFKSRDVTYIFANINFSAKVIFKL